MSPSEDGAVSSTTPEPFGYDRLIGDIFRASGGKGSTGPTMPPGRRGDVVGVLSQVLVRKDLLRKYLDRLVKAEQTGHPAFDTIAAHRDSFPIEELVANGLACLDDGQVARLALDAAELASLHDYLDELLDAGECGQVWYDLMIQDSDDAVPYEAGLSPQQPAATVIILLARRTARAGSYRSVDQSAADPAMSWTLGSAGGEGTVTLPRDLSSMCYGADAQEVSMQLQRLSSRAGQWEARVEVAPPPRHRGIEIRVTFRTGERRSFAVTLDTGASATSSAWCDPLPPEAFGDENWSVPVEFSPLRS